MGLRNVVQQVLDWLRAGYPNGVPSEDYVALLGILRHRLTEHDVAEVAAALLASGDGEVTEDDIRDGIARLNLQTATDEDVRRVSAALAAGGWPLGSVDSTPDEGTGDEGTDDEGTDSGIAESQGAS